MSKIGSWAEEAEREEAEQLAAAADDDALASAQPLPVPSFNKQPAAAAAAAAATSSTATAKPKKKKMSLAEFYSESQVLAPHPFPDPSLHLPTTGPVNPTGQHPNVPYGQGFSNFSNRNNSSGGNVHRNYNHDNNIYSGNTCNVGSSFGKRSPYGGNGFNESGKMGSAQFRVDDRGVGRKPVDSFNQVGSFGSGFGVGGGLPYSRADEVDNWSLEKKSVAVNRSNAMAGSGFRDDRQFGENVRGNEFGEMQKSSISFGTARTREMGLDWRKPNPERPTSSHSSRPSSAHSERSEAVGEVAAKSKVKVNPFGDAKPREVLLEEKGVDWRKSDSEIEVKRPNSSHSSRPSSAHSERSEGVGDGAAKSKVKVNPFGEAKPREVLLEEKGLDWRKIDLELEQRRVDRPKSEEERILKQEIDHLKDVQRASLMSHDSEPAAGPGDKQRSLRDLILCKERDLELLVRQLDDKISFGQKAVERRKSGSGRVASFPEKPPSPSGSLEGSGSMEFNERPRSRGSMDARARPGFDNRGPFRGGRGGGFFSSSSVDRPTTHGERW